MNAHNVRHIGRLLSTRRMIIVLSMICLWSDLSFVQMAVAQGAVTTSDKKAGQDESFSFVFMTDIHAQPERNGTEALLLAIDTVNQLNPDFVITGGDNVTDASAQSYKRASSLYSLFIETMKSLHMPYHTTIGNHDYCQRGKDEGPLKVEQRKDIYKAHFGRRYYSFEHKNWYFIVLDSIMFGQGEYYYYGGIDPEQMAWLRNVLDSIGKERPVVVSLHVPLLSIDYQIRENGATPRAVIRRKNAQEILKLFEQYNVKLVLQGHLHLYEDILYKGIHYITGGAVCSGHWTHEREGLKGGFVLVEVNGEDFTAEYIDYGWDMEKDKKKERGAVHVSR